ncbi:hypothetical protein KVR01_013363 [Diaporthe batatas]|uniref:uncharacterized protein n=1 Tax=Diaporthe batatas TaxID=748121 RepID=UPI001D050DA6|nr:uncharacterized protein KVR01_013363 [Diaporthe batatas]KAG8156758.1 hypothetical protein KVR01_013363 [Diaporthe batatas]
MAEALGLASSIVALVQLSASVYSATSKFCREAKDAKSKINALATQIRNLSGVLQSLSLLASAPLFDDFGVSGTDFRNTYIESCHSTLHKIKRKLEKAEWDIETGGNRKLITRSLKWPFSSQETNELVAELSQHQNVLQLALSADTMSQLLQCLANTESTAKSVLHLNQMFDRKQNIDLRTELTKKREEIVRFFIKVNPEDYLQDCRSRRQPNTGKWLTERNESFQDWLNSPGSQIWLSGIPGAGKTMLCGTVIEEILQKQSTSTAVAFFFCDYKSAESQEPINVLGALAVQIAKQADAAFELLEAYYEELHPQNGMAKPPERKGMIKVIQAMINQYDSAYVAVDGLDECGSKAVEVIHALKELANGDQVTMALFSRYEPDIADELSDSLRIEIAAHTEDLELYVLAQMETRKRLASLAVRNAELHKHILRTLIQGANGMFRWVACQLDYIDGLPSDGRRRRALSELPPTLFETYDRILDRIMQGDEQSQDLCRKALHWIGLGSYSLNSRALCEAISIPVDQDEADPEQFVDTEWVSRSCSSLIRLSGQSFKIPHFQLAHFTVKEYLRSIEPRSKRGAFRFSEGEAIQELLETSLRFLTFPVFDQAPMIAVSEIERMEQRNQKHPFYPAAARYIFFWNTDGGNIDAAMGNELASLVNDETMMQYAMKLFDPDKTTFFHSWVLQAIWLWKIESRGALFPEIVGLLFAPEFSTLHVAATLALPSICKYLVETRNFDINKWCRIGTPLHGLMTGIGIYHPNDHGHFQFRSYHGTRLKPATCTQYRECLEIFVRHSADTSARLGGWSVFQMGIHNHSCSDWIKPLVTPSTVIYEDCIDDFKILIIEKYLHTSVVDAIYQLGATPGVPPMWARLASVIETNRMKERLHEGKSPTNSQILSDEDFDDAIRISLEQHLADNLKSIVQDPRFRPDICISGKGPDIWPEPILHFAIRVGNPRLLQLLLEANCDPKLVHEADGWTGLHQCARFNRVDAANAVFLLRAGVSDLVKNMNGKTCWHTAAANGNIPVLNALIELGSNTANTLCTTSKQGRTPLAAAILESEIESALLLLDHCHVGFEVFQSDKSLLDEAISIGSATLFTRLYEQMKQAGSNEALQLSKPLKNINMACSPKLLSYLLTTWPTDDKGKSEALTNYLLDANSPEFKDPTRYPEKADLRQIIRQLLPSVATVDKQNSSVEFWSTFCDKVVVNLTRSCIHQNNSTCRKNLVTMIFEILIETGALDSYERNMNLSSCSKLFRSLLDRGRDLTCSWIAPSVHRVIKRSTLSEDLANDAASEKVLSLAVQQSNTDLVEQLLHYGVSVHAACNGLSPIEQACYSADLPTFKLVIKHADKSQINSAGTEGKTLLHLAVSGTAPGYLDKIQRLLQLDADIDAKVDDPNEDTALTLASRTERQDIVALLVSEGANALHRGRDGWTILHAAALTGDLRYLRSLDRAHVPSSYWRGTCDFPLVHIHRRNTAHIKQNVTAAHLAADRGRTNFLRFMAQHNLPLEVNAMTGIPAIAPLHVACLWGHLEVVEFLVAAKANINARDSDGRLPIDIAARREDIATVKVLLKSGSAPPSSISGLSLARLLSEETETVEGSRNSKAMSRFSFEQAIIDGDLSRCKEMAKSGESIDAKLLTHEFTPLVRAVIQGQTAIVDWLVSSAVEVSNPVISGLHPELRCIASLATYYFRSPQTLSAVMSLALSQGVSWHESILGPLHVAILDRNMEALEVTLKQIRKNDHAYRRMIEADLICAPAATVQWRHRTALNILVNSFNHKKALSDNSLWEVKWPPGSPLHWAIRNSDVPAVKLLLENEADVNKADSRGRTPLELAVSSKHPAELVQELLQAGAGLAEPSGNRIETMEDAVCNGDIGVIKALAEADPETLKGVSQCSADTLLQSAPSAAVFQFLVSRGADPFKGMELPAGYSAVASLIDPDYELSGFALNSGLVVQSSEDSLAFCLFKLANDSGQESVCLVKMIGRVIRSDAFMHAVNTTSRAFGSTLCVAASLDATGMVKALMTMGAELELEGCRYGSPLMAACAWGNLDAARCLVRAGAQLCYVNDEGTQRSAVRAASRHKKVIQWLLVGRYTEQLKIDYQPSQATSHETVWSGPRLFKLALPTYMHRDFDESRWSHLRRLQKWSEGLRGCALAESRRNSGLDFDAEFGAASSQRVAQAAHERFLASLGESREQSALGGT